MPTALGSPEHYRVLPTLQDVDGYACHVVTAGRDTMWIDAQHGYAVRRRVWFSKRSRDDPGSLGNLQCCKKFREVEDGVWWPQEIHLVNYLDSEEPDSRKGKVWQVQRFVVEDLRVNDVPDSTFEFTFPPGTLVADRRTNIAYYMPDEVEMLDEAIALGIPIEDGIVRGEPGRIFKPDPQGASRFKIIVIGNVVFLAVITIVLLVRRRRAAKTSVSSS